MFLLVPRAPFRSSLCANPARPVISEVLHRPIPAGSYCPTGGPGVGWIEPHPAHSRHRLCCPRRRTRSDYTPGRRNGQAIIGAAGQGGARLTLHGSPRCLNRAALGAKMSPPSQRSRQKRVCTKIARSLHRLARSAYSRFSRIFSGMICSTYRRSGSGAWASISLSWR